ncbi:zinc protease [Orenia metallireducens]|uniref:Zinc protease n=1 Tax=Orenia metallireducens TaxID=1413210 RepID=A0A285HUH1_9FIRM|nr:pitrilysin family protein [Orenia metallireducens]PRX30980.1 zinc protease [Orenia metallireducens]SNY39355.1 zinc protease [Orenia metallireducens]
MRKFFKILLLSLLLILFGVSSIYAQQLNQKELFIPKLDYSHFKLDNGLEIYVFEDHKIPLAKFSIWYKVGSIDEPEGISGISHLLEHTMFLGTESLAKDQVHQLIKSVGGSNNAGTYYDYTTYYEEIPSAKLELAMAIEADRMRNLKVNPEEFYREREVVKQERRMRVENNIFSSSLEEIQAEAFKESPLHHQVIGWMEDINNITVEDIRDYYTRYYAPNNGVMVVSGDVDPQEVHTLAQKYYGSYQPQEIKRLEAIEPEQKSERIIKLKKMTQVPIIAMLYKIPKGDHPDMVAINALLDILVNNSTSRVKTELQQKKRMILEAGGFTVGLRKPGYALLYTVPMSEGIVYDVRYDFDQELEKLIEQGIKENELKIVKKRVLKDLIFSQKDISSAADTVATSVVRYNDPTLYQKNIQRLKNLTTKDIIRVAQKYFVRDNRTIGYILPKN